MRGCVFNACVNDLRTWDGLKTKTSPEYFVFLICFGPILSENSVVTAYFGLRCVNIFKTNSRKIKYNLEFTSPNNKNGRLCVWFVRTWGELTFWWAELVFPLFSLVSHCKLWAKALKQPKNVRKKWKNVSSFFAHFTQKSRKMLTHFGRIFHLKNNDFSKKCWNIFHLLSSENNTYCNSCCCWCVPKVRKLI